MAEDTPEFKVVILGDSGVGKSNIMNRFTKNEFNELESTNVQNDFVDRTILDNQCTNGWDPKH